MNITMQISQEEHDTIDSLHFVYILFQVIMHTSGTIGKLLHFICRCTIATKSFPDYSIIVGVPAKLIKKRK